MLDLFMDPPTQYRIAPLWLWNTKPNVDEIERQIREMNEKGIGGFYIIEDTYSNPSSDANDRLACIERAKVVAGELGMIACSGNSISRMGVDNRMSIGKIVDIPASNGASVSALVINSGWPTTVKGTEALREKLGVSTAHSGGLNRVVSTPFTDAQWSLTPAKMKASIDQAAALGVNAFSPSGFLYSIAQPYAQYPIPSQFYQSTYWSNYKQLADYTARLCYALSQGRHKAQIALLNPVKGFTYEYSEDSNGIAAGLTVNYFNAFCEHLLKEHLDYDIVCEESVCRALAVDQHLMIENEEYDLLIMPPMTTIGYDTAKKIAEYVDDGGALMGTSLLPLRDANGERHDDVRSIFSDIFDLDPTHLRAHAQSGHLIRRPRLSHNSANLLFYESSDAAELIPGLRGTISMLIKPEVSVRRSGSECPDIIYHHRVVGDEDLFFFFNTAPEPRDVKMSIRCDKAPYVLDPETGKRTALADCTAKGSRTIFMRRFEPNEALLIQFTNELVLPAILPPTNDGYEIVLADEWSFGIEGHNCLTLQLCALDKPEHNIGTNQAYTASFNVDTPPAKLFFVIESRHAEILVNGQPVQRESTWLIDVGFEALDISSQIKAGTNEVTVMVKRESTDAGSASPAPHARLMGAFSLNQAKSTIMPPREKIRNGSWTGQGYPFYSGTATYTQQTEIPGLFSHQRVFLRVSNPADIVEFVVNGTSAGTRLWAPYELDITHLIKPGKNSITLKVTNSPANALLSTPKPSGLLHGARLVIY